MATARMKAERVVNGTTEMSKEIARGVRDKSSEVAHDAREKSIKLATKAKDKTQPAFAALSAKFSALTTKKKKEEYEGLSEERSFTP